MNIYTHYKNGTSVEVNGYEVEGYQPARNEEPLHIHITFDHYHIHIDPLFISVKYKYLALVKDKCFRVGMNRYPLEMINSSPERKHLSVLNDILDDLMMGYVEDKKLSYKLTKIINTHKEE